jgi:MFS family permease
VYNAAWALGLLAGPVTGGFLFDRLGLVRLLTGWALSVIVITVLIAGVRRGPNIAPPV